MKKGLGGLHISRADGGAVRGGKYSDKELYKAFCDGYREGLAYNSSDEAEESLLTIDESGRVVIKEVVEDVEEVTNKHWGSNLLEDLFSKSYYVLDECNAIVLSQDDNYFVTFTTRDFKETRYKGVKFICISDSAVMPLMEDVNRRNHKAVVSEILTEMLGVNDARRLLEGRFMFPLSDDILQK